MIVVVDANIIISAIINPYGSIPEIILQNRRIDFIIPDYALEEIALHKLRICEETKTSVFLFDKLQEKLLSHILVFSADNVSVEYMEEASKLTLSVDVKDALYVAFCLALDAVLWTGDLKLYKGLRRKDFLNIITTSELKDILKGLI